MSVAAPESSVADAFAAALRQDAAAAPPEIPPPPRAAVAADPAAPHGREADGTPRAPHGLKADGTPRLKPAGPGRGHKRTEDAPRTTTKVPATSSAGSPASGAQAAAAGPDYTGDLAGLAHAVWMGCAAFRPLRPYGAIWHEHSGPMVNAWAEAARQNATVRGYVEKLAGDGSWAWVIGVTVTTMPVALGFWDLARPLKDAQAKAERDRLKADLAKRTEAEFTEYVTSQLKAMGLTPEQLAAAGAAADGPVAVMVA